MADLSIIIETNAKEASKEIGGLSNSISKSAAKASQLTKAFAFLDKAVNKGKISGTQYSSMIDKLDKEESQLYSALGKTTSGLNQQSAALSRGSKAATNAAFAAEQLASRQRMAGKSTNRFGMYSQQVGYQVGDMVVQIQGGTDALLAFGQQGTQLAGLLPGLAGAVIGIGLSLSTALGKAALQAKGLQIDFKGVINELKKPLQTIKPLLDGITSAFQVIGSASKTVLSTLISNLDRVVLYIAVAATGFGTRLVAGLIAARLATFTLAGAFAFLRTAIIRTGIGALIIIVAEAIRMFMLLAKQVGGFAPLLTLLKDAFVEQLGKISLIFEWLGQKVKEIFFGMKKNVLEILSDILSKVNNNFVNKFIGMFSGAIAAAAEYIKSLPAIFVTVFKSVQKAVADGVNNFIRPIGTGLNYLREKVHMERIDFGDVFDTSAMTGHNVGGVLSNAKANIANAYAQATAIDYVTAAQNGLTAAIKDAGVAEFKAGTEAALTAVAVGTLGQATQDLLDVYNNLPSPDQIDFDNMLKPDGGNAGGSGSIDKTLLEIELSKKLALAYGEEADRQRLILDIKGQLGDSVSKYTEATIAASADRIRAYEAEQEALKQAAQQQEQLANHIANSMGDALTSIVDGTKTVKDAFKAMTTDIIGMFKDMLIKMTTMALENKIKLFIGTGAVGGAAGTGLLGGIGSVASGFMSGGLGGAADAIGTAVSGATTGLAGFGAAVGAVALPLLAVAAVFSFFSKKTKELDSGINITIKNMDTYVESWKKLETKQFWGLSKSVTDKIEAASAEISNPITEAILGIQTSVFNMAGYIGIATSALDKFTYDLKLSLKGLTEDQQMAKINEELTKLGDSFAALLPKVSSMAELTAIYQERLNLETRLLQAQGDTEALRKIEMSSINDYNKSLLQQIYDTEDAKSAMDDLNASLSALSENDFATMLDFKRAQAKIRMGLPVANDLNMPTVPAISASTSIANTNSSTVTELRSIREDIKEMHKESMFAYSKLIKNGKDSRDTLRSWDVVGLPAERTA